MRRPRLPALLCAAILIAIASATAARAQENFSAKPAPQLFSSDCTGSGCHSGPQGLAKGMTQGGLASFLRAHYTNSRESAASIAAYLMTLANAPAPRDPRARRQQAEPAQQPGAKPSARSAARSDEPAQASRGKPDTTAKPEAKPDAKSEPRLTPAQQRAAQRARQQQAQQAQAAAAAAQAAPEPPPEPPKPEPPKAHQWEIFD